MAGIKDDDADRGVADPLGLGGVSDADAPSRKPRPRVLALAGEFLRMSRATAILLGVFVLVGALYLLVKDDPVVRVGTGSPAPTAPADPGGVDDSTTTGTDDATTTTSEPTPTTDPDSTGTTESTVPTTEDNPSTTTDRGRPGPQDGQVTEGPGGSSSPGPAGTSQAQAPDDAATDGAAGAGADDTSGGRQAAE